MRIGLNALLLSNGENYRQTGISRYIEQLIAALGEIASPSELIAYIDRNSAVDHWPHVALRRTPVSVANPAVRIAWENAMLPVLTRKDRLNVFHGMVNTLPVSVRGTSVLTVHDLAFLHYPEQVTARRYHYLNRMMGWSVKRADAILAPSEFTRGDILERFGADPSRVFVSPLGVDERFHPASESEIGATCQRYRLDQGFILSVGTIEPRKNLPRLVKAFVAIADQIPHDLVFVGPDGWLDDDIRASIDRSGVGTRVRRIGFVNDEELRALYSGADVVAMPSLYEGFGLPVLEAMACGTAVVTSSSSSLPEVAGDAAQLVDPLSVESIANGLLSVLTNDSYRVELERESLLRVSSFTWQRTAECTMAAYRSVI